MANFPNNSWHPIFTEAKEKGLFISITKKLKQEKATGKTIYPPSSDIFRAFELCDFEKLKVVLLGQDPYHGLGEANGLCFSVHEGIKTPPSLRNIFKELQAEYLGDSIHRSTDLSDWAEQGVLLINAVLTVEKDKPASHSSFGWQQFTDSIIQTISQKKEHVVFILLGNFAKSKTPLIDAQRHAILTAAHPSPFSAHNGFFGSNIFIKCNEYLSQHGQLPIRW